MIGLKLLKAVVAEMEWKPTETKPNKQKKTNGALSHGEFSERENGQVLAIRWQVE